MKILIFILGLLYFQFSFTQQRFNGKSNENLFLQKINGSLLQNDLKQLRKTILSAHPNPFVYIEKQAWDSTYFQLLEYFERPRTVFDFVEKSAKWLNQLKDSHISFDLGEILEQYYPNKSWLIFELARIENKFYAAFFKDNKVPYGNEIISINSIPVDSIYNLALSFAIQEGNSWEAKHKYATTIIAPLFNLMSKLSKDPQKIPILHINEKGDTLFSFVETISPKERMNYLKNQIWKEEDIEYSVDEENNYGILTLYTFMPENKRKFEKTLDHFFDEIKSKEISKILIDIRWNRGGYFNYVEYIFNYLDTTDLVREKTYLAKRSKFDKVSSMNIISKWLLVNVAKFQRTDKELQEYVRYYKLPYGSIDTVYEKQDFSMSLSKFEGTCFLAMNGVSISASVDFASWFQNSKRGLILGEECMGPLTGTCGNPTVFQLNNTKISVMTSTMRSYTNSTFDIGIQPIRPDISIKYSLSDYRSKNDPVVQFFKQQK